MDDVPHELGDVPQPVGDAAPMDVGGGAGCLEGDNDVKEVGPVFQFHQAEDAMGVEEGKRAIFLLILFFWY